MTRETTRALAGAALCLAGLVALGLVVYSPDGILFDEHSMRAFTRLYEPSADRPATAFVSLGGPAMAVLISLDSRRRRSSAAGRGSPRSR